MKSVKHISFLYHKKAYKVFNVYSEEKIVL